MNANKHSKQKRRPLNYPLRWKIVNLEDELPQRTFLLVASIANIFQGFDSGIYTVIISEKPFINLFNVSGTRSGVVASMVNLDNVLGNLFVASWFIWYLGRGSAFGLGTIVLLDDVALQAGAVAFSMIVIGRIVAGIRTAIISTNLAAFINGVVGLLLLQEAARW